MKINISCPCGNNFPFSFEEEVDIDKNPNHLEDIQQGKFLSFDCPSCFKQHKPEYKIIIIWKSRNYKLAVIPELDRNMFYIKKKENPPFETVIGFPEMIDRIKVLNDNLEPVVIEAIKTFLIAKAMESYNDNNDNNINVWYHRKTDDGLEFHLEGIKQDEVAVVKIPLDMYAKTLQDYEKNPQKALFASLRVRKYLSVQNIYRPDVLK
ncbi:MAG: CpXC domain-containing protein [Treponema sp.]|jgi:hypothetical protein|nr:CpXC domain-containing protein [Treponema sp.]